MPPPHAQHQPRRALDVGKPFAEGSYLEIEQAFMRGRPHTSCGGRPLNDDGLDLSSRSSSRAATADVRGRVEAATMAHRLGLVQAPR